MTLVSSLAERKKYFRIVMGHNSTSCIPSCVDCKKKRENENLFCTLSIEELSNVSEQKGKNFFKKGETVFYEDNHPHGVYCIFEGKVKIHKIGESGKEQIVRFAGDGDILGYRALLSGESYNATATAIEDSKICYIAKDKFLTVLDGNPKASNHIIKMLSEDLRVSEQKILNLTQKTVREKIAEAILILQKRFGFEADKKTVNIVLTRREIGDIVGITTETTIRTLSEFSKEGIIELNGKKIAIANMKALVNTANLYE